MPVTQKNNTCTKCQSEIPTSYRSGLCLPCRKHKNYQAVREKAIKHSQQRWQEKKQQRLYKHCSLCNKELNINNVSGFCRLHYKQQVPKDKKRQQNKEWYIKNGKQYYRKRYQTDLKYRLLTVLRSRLNSAIKKNQKTGSAISDLGCSIEELKKHLESKFLPGMTWDNWTTNGWHIDHIRPLSSFDLQDPKELKKACHYSNLQPLWAQDNLSKNATID